MDEKTLKLVQPRTFKELCSEEVVPILENLLERAKKGEIVNFVVVFETNDDTVDCDWNSSFDFLRRLGALESVKLDWYNTIGDGER